ncbi:MAG: type II toxin-antitoxin system VapC family toxin [Burkholderiales bacterium]
MNGVLVDTSVWVDHFRRRNNALVALLEADMVLTHPMVLLELSCGTPPQPRAQTLGDIGLLRQTQQATLQEVMDFVEREHLYGLGCGLVDMVLLASTLMTQGARLWTLDKRLATLAERFAVVHSADLH